MIIQNSNILLEQALSLNILILALTKNRLVNLLAIILICTKSISANLFGLLSYYCSTIKSVIIPLIECRYRLI